MNDERTNIRVLISTWCKQPLTERTRTVWLDIRNQYTQTPQTNRKKSNHLLVDFSST